MPASARFSMASASALSIATRRSGCPAGNTATTQSSQAEFKWSFCQAWAARFAIPRRVEQRAPWQHAHRSSLTRPRCWHLQGLGTRGHRSLLPYRSIHIVTLPSPGRVSLAERGGLADGRVSIDWRGWSPRSIRWQAPYGRARTHHRRRAPVPGHPE